MTLTFKPRHHYHGQYITAGETIAHMNIDSRDCSHFYKLSYYKFKNIEGRKQNADSLKIPRFVKDRPFQNLFYC